MYGGVGPSRITKSLAESLPDGASLRALRRRFVHPGCTNHKRLLLRPRQQRCPKAEAAGERRSERKALITPLHRPLHPGTELAPLAWVTDVTTVKTLRAPPRVSSASPICSGTNPQLAPEKCSELGSNRSAALSCSRAQEKYREFGMWCNSRSPCQKTRGYDLRFKRKGFADPRS